MFDQDHLRAAAYHHELQQAAHHQAAKNAPATMKFWGVITVILVAAWAVDQVLITIQNWYSAVVG